MTTKPKLILCDYSSEMTDAWQEEFNNEQNVRILNCDFRNIPEYITEPLIMCAAGNSYGIMGGGIDLAIARFFSGVEGKIRLKIKHKFSGELPVGSLVMVGLDTIYQPFWYVFYTPTMVAPTILQDAYNVYAATKIALEQQKFMGLGQPYLVLPGFGRLCGHLSAATVARNMKEAYDTVVNGVKVTNHSQMNERYTYLKETWG